MSEITKTEQGCGFTISDGVIKLWNSEFSTSFSGVSNPDIQKIVPQSRSLPYVEITAEREDKTQCCWQMWADLAAVRIVCGAPEELLELEGQHWTVRTVKLNAFTDHRDTLVEENKFNFFRKGVVDRLEGEIFFLEDPETERAIVIISETPDWVRGKLKIPIKTDQAAKERAKILLCNEGYPVVLGFCRRGECEALCRDYFRHANHCNRLVTMSNTWGDRNGDSRVCEAFVRREIEAAREIGVDIVQIDDGWQSGNTLYQLPRDERGNRRFDGSYWEINNERFPNGIKPLADLAAEYGIKLGLWFAPYSHECFKEIERDKATFRHAYEEYGARFFKLDMYQAASREATDKMLELLESIYSLGSDVSVQMDVTRYERLNYLCGREYGTVFVENRYTRGVFTYYPHRVLRNLWCLSKYLPTSRFQFEMPNPDISVVSYEASDPFAPALCDMDYLFALVMLSNPLFWQEIQFLSTARRAELAPLLSVWKEHREILASADVMPIGEQPSGRSFSGFFVSADSGDYLLLFREVTESDTGIFIIPSEKRKTTLLASNGDVEVKLDDGVVRAKFSKPRCYAFLKLN